MARLNGEPPLRLGVARARGYHLACEGCRTVDTSGPTSALAYDFALHANAMALGITTSFSGGLGPAPVPYSSFSVGLELGWFGR